VFLGEIGPQDRVDRAVEVLDDLVRERGIDTELLIIGDGPERPVIEQVVSDRQLQDRVTITGFLPYERVPEQLETGHVGIDTTAFTATSHGTTMIKIGEYLSVGLPVVASELRETRITADSALTAVEDDTLYAFTEPLVRLLTDKHAWSIAAKLARERGALLQWDTQAAKLIAAYQSLRPSVT
jgi:glycosyltransferase involved in cell wall biosynthesis